MSDHYFSKNPGVTSNPMKWSYKLREFNLTFNTDRGVFSKGEVDFGSRLLIEYFTEPDIGGSLLDVGCGYGPIGLTLAKAFPRRKVHMVDVNERAIQLAIKNSMENRVENNTEVFLSNGFENVTEKGYAAILTNPPIRAGKQTVFSILENSYHHLQTGGELWVVIQKKQGAPSAHKKLEEVFGEVEVVKRDKGYYIFKAKKID